MQTIKETKIVLNAGDSLFIVTSDDPNGPMLSVRCVAPESRDDENHGLDVVIPETANLEMIGTVKLHSEFNHDEKGEFEMSVVGRTIVRI
jgi:hypothetical protein